MKRFKKILVLIFLPIVVFSTDYNCLEPTASIDFEINNIRTKLHNGGDLFWDYLQENNTAYSFEVPKGSGKHSSFSNSIWFGGIDESNNLYLSAETYRTGRRDFSQGPLNDTGGTTLVECKIWNKIFNVYGAEILNHKKNRTENYNIYKWPTEYAPYYDNNDDGIYDPSMGDYPILDKSKPDIIPGQMAFWIINDVGTRENPSQSNAFLRFEIHTLVYAFQSDLESINNSIFIKYKLINKSNISYSNFKFSYYHDFDIGNHTDDYSGCDLSVNSRGIKRNLSYVYNSDPIDEKYFSESYYSSAPPATGLLIFESNKSSSMMYNNSVESMLVYDSDCGMCMPFEYEDEYVWELMNAKIPGFETGFKYGSEKGLGLVGENTKFTFPGDTDPNGRPAWYETGTSMIRPLNISTIGLNMFQPGEVKEVDYAVVWARDTPGTHLSSLNKLRLTSDTVIDAYNAFFKNYVLNVKNEQRVSYSFYPNPSSNYIRLNSNNMLWNKDITVEIFDLEGKKLIETKIQPKDEIDVRSLKEGIYIIKINDHSSKLLINRN